MKEEIRKEVMKVFNQEANVDDVVDNILRLFVVMESDCKHKYGGIGICDSEDGGTCGECPYLKQNVR